MVAYGRTEALYPLVLMNFDLVLILRLAKPSD